jgi:hypothetical protein
MGKRFTLKEAEEFFNLSMNEIQEHVESGKPIAVGIRYWYVDELLVPGDSNEENVG